MLHVCVFSFRNMALQMNEQSKIRLWRKTVVELEAIKKLELELRNELACLFHEPKEGINSLTVEGGVLKLNHKFNRRIDEASLDAVMGEMEIGAREGLIAWKPNLALKKYKALSEDQRRIFDQTLTIEPATPSLEFIPNKD